MEEVYHVLRGVRRFPVMPIDHQKDWRIREQGYRYMTGLLLYLYAQLRL